MFFSLFLKGGLIESHSGDQDDIKVTMYPGSHQKLRATLLPKHQKNMITDMC